MLYNDWDKHGLYLHTLKVEFIKFNVVVLNAWIQSTNIIKEWPLDNVLRRMKTLYSHIISLVFVADGKNDK